MNKSEKTNLNPQGRLQLKTNNNLSMQAISSSDKEAMLQNEAQPEPLSAANRQSFHKENFKSDSKDNEEDSLADFKSPKQQPVRKPFFDKYKVDAERKSRKKMAKSKTKSTVKTRKSLANQPSIEASLLRPQTSDVKEAIPCPVCLKLFLDDATCTNHMKNCAAKNNVSIQQLLEAKRLQERQAQERKAIGLLAAPIISEKKKPFRSKNFSTKDDPQLQLVLAMSASLYEAQTKVELEEAALLAGIPTECITEMNEEERRKTLQNFGFTTNKPMIDAPTSRQKKKKLLGATVLQTRSKEDKDRVLTERIACILTGEDALTQAHENTTVTSENKTPTSITSEFLKNIEQKDNKLWDQSRLTQQSHNFFVNTLKANFFKPIQQPVESETHEWLAEHSEENIDIVNNSVVYDPMDIDVIVNNQEVKLENGHCDRLNMNESNFEVEFVQNYNDCWKEILNDSSASDVVIFVKNNKHIYAHQLVFHVQCPNILLDIEQLHAALGFSIKKKISWVDKQQLSALAFLEFIYSGTISKYINVFYQKELVHQVEQLARLYKKQSLFTYIRKKQKEVEFQRQDLLQSFSHIQEQEAGNKLQQSSDNPNDCRNNTLEMEVSQTNPHTNIHYSINYIITKELLSEKLQTTRFVDRRITASPDLFDSEDEVDRSNVRTKNISDSENYASKNYDIKEEMDNVENFDESDHLNSQKTLVNLSRSVSPVDNIHEAITPPSGRSPEGHRRELEENQISREREIAEAITPKCQSPETIVDIKPEINKIDDLSCAITPEYISPTGLNNYVTPKKLVYASTTLNDIEPQDPVNESIYTAVTPPKLHKESIPTISENINNGKSELTMFIEKVQRKNAKHIMDTDSETDTPDNRVRHKNPFLKRDQDDSYRYLRNRDQKYHKAISLLEKDLLNEQRVQKNLEASEINLDESIKSIPECLGNDNPSPSKLQKASVNNSSICETSKNTMEDVEVQDITVDESMYTKYKKSNKSDNSIGFYRKQLNFAGQKIDAKDKFASFKENSEHSTLPNTSKSTNFQSVTMRKPMPRIIQDITLVSDSDEADSPLRAFLRDKKNSYRKSPVTDMSIRDAKIDEPTSIENDEHSIVLKNDSTNKIIDLSVDSDEDSIHDKSNFTNHLADRQDISLRKSKSFIKESEASIIKRKALEDAEKKCEDIDIEISKILGSSPTIHENLMSDQEEADKNKEYNDVQKANFEIRESQRKIVVSSPISIPSSPEICQTDMNNSQKSKNDHVAGRKRGTYSQNSESSPAVGENGDFDFFDVDDWNVKTPPRETVKSMKPFEKSAKVRSPTKNLNYDDTPAKSVESNVIDHEIQELLSSPILSQNRRSLREIQDKTVNSNSRFKKIGASSENKIEDTRKLNTKFASTGNMGKIDHVNMQRSSSFDTPEKNEKSLINNKDMTPPVNYSLLDTPNLQKELKRFGLKPQNRTNAKALLTHIYKETHSQPSASQKRISTTESSSEEDAPPAKRQYIKKVTKNADATDESTSKPEKKPDNSPVIAEEMDFDDPDVASIIQNPVSIKDAFFKLVKTNRELYNQVLTYEPLPLETLHSMLKQNGFKCQLNNLMNFLDEQCITFQVKSNKGDRAANKLL